MIFSTLTKRTIFYKRKSVDKRDCLLYFVLDDWHENVLYTVFTRNFSEVVRGQVFFIFVVENSITKIKKLIGHITHPQIYFTRVTQL